MSRRSRSNGPLPADVREAVSALGIKIDHVQKDELWALCPAHKERNASWSINEITGKHKCFSCGWGGNFLYLVKYMKQSDDERAREWVRKMGGLEHFRRKRRGEVYYEPPDPEPVEEADLALYGSPPEWALKDKDVSKEACARYGVLWDDENNRWICPIRDPYTNELRGWQEKNKRFFKNHPDNMIKSDCFFGSDTITQEARTLIVVESPLDAVHLSTYGIGTAIASMGVHLSTEQLQYLLESGRHILFALDNDRDGINISEKIRKEYLGRMKMSFYNYGDTKDKDPGTHSAVQMRWGVINATSSVITRF